MNALQNLLLDEVLEEVAEHTDNNCHTEALITLAELFELKKLVEQLKNVKQLHIYFGHLTPELMSLRNHLTTILENEVKKVTTEKEFKKIKSAF